MKYLSVKVLIETKEWKDYENLLEEIRQGLFQEIENTSTPAEELRHRLQELRLIQRLPHQIVKEFEQKEKEK